MRKLQLMVVFVLSAVFPVSIYLKKPPDGPVITTLPGHVLSRETIKIIDGSLLYSWNEHRLFFKEDGAVDTESINVNELHRLPGPTEHCRLSYKEKWVFNLFGLDWNRTKTLVSIEML